jgi:hypothetical protein
MGTYFVRNKFFLLTNSKEKSAVKNYLLYLSLNRQALQFMVKYFIITGGLNEKN